MRQSRLTVRFIDAGFVPPLYPASCAVPRTQAARLASGCMDGRSIRGSWPMQARCLSRPLRSLRGSAKEKARNTFWLGLGLGEAA